jgi:hypothetical protein
MRNFSTLLLFLLLGISMMQGQAVYSDHFDNNDPAFMGGATSYTFSESGSDLTVTASNTGAWDVFTYQLHDAVTNMAVTADVSGNNKLYIRAKASNVGTQLRVDLQDTPGYTTSQAGLTKTLTTNFNVLEFDFDGQYLDGGFGGTPCSSGPCGVDSSDIASLIMYTNPGAGGFSGTVIIDYISFGSPPDTVIASNVFQDHFTDTSSINSVTFVGAGYTVSQSGTNLHISGDGTTPMWDPLTYIFINPNTGDTIDIDITGNNKLYVKAKSTIPGTALRIDAQDIDSYVTTQGSITKIVDTAYQVFEYDFTGVLADLGYGGTPCTQATAPCPVDGTRIADLLFFIEPGVGAYTGVLSIDYISFGVSLDPPGPEAALIYEDHFGNDLVEFTTPNAGFTVDEMGSDLIIVGDSTAAPYASISYLLHDKDSAQQIFLNMGPAKNKVFIRAKVNQGTVPLRVDLIDTANYHTSQASLTKVLNDQWAIYEFDFTGVYFDGGFGGTSCMTGPCPVDPAAITQILLFVDPIQGAFQGEVLVDFISIGKPLGEDKGPKGIINYYDEMDDNTSLFITDPAGLSSTTMNSEWVITGDGTGGPWNSVLYDTHTDMGDLQMADAVGSNDKLFIRAKASAGSPVLRIDLQDNLDYVTNLNSQSVTLDTTYQIYELTYTGAYRDGAFGGSPCTVSGCPVDGERIAHLQFFIDPGTGMYNGTVSIDWVSFGTQNVSIEAHEMLQSFRAYPNPTQDQLRVDYTLLKAAKVNIVLTNMLGQQVLRQDMEQQYAGQQSTKLDLQNLPQGMYFVQILTDGQLTGTLRVVKQ